MPQLSLKFNDLKGCFRVQTEKIQAQLFGEVCPTREMVLSPLSGVLQVSTAKPRHAPAVVSATSSGFGSA